ncbi:TonB-dependent receptor [Aliiroseovarius subalbicans]|uniref:TonB-dependent receptor plug domain-containing protein n=1 Tax=Aliiroseovarius subalbicans TaxID=2925840 RepID=UPI001F57F26C|nr:TonB-dependent receptor [Aliiroseovarius subalbicans]MCI2399233.1 TonB-dependent receptor [Aliiroseovarius subalbicans]
MSHLKRSTAALTLAVLVPSLVMAQDAFDLGTITVISNAEETRLENSGTTVEVVTGDALKGQTSAQIARYFTTLPGVSVTNNGGTGQLATLKVRGLGASYLPVFVNGINMTDPASTGNGFSWGGLTGAGLGRIELLKGGQSARFGQGAVGGVVAIETWRPEVDGFSGEVTTEFGSYNTLVGNVNLGFRNDRSELAFTASKIKTDGFSARVGNDEADGYDATQLNLTASHQLTDNILVGFAAMSTDSLVDYDSALADPTGNTETASRAGRVFAEFATGAVDHKISAARMTTTRDDTGYYAYFFGARNALAYEGNMQIGMADVTFGADYTAENAETRNSFGGVETLAADTTALFAEAALSPSDALDVVVSLRHDMPSNFDPMTSGRIAAAWRPSDDWIIRAQAGTGFRAPSLYELNTYDGNPAFQPEESLNLELGVERRLGGDDFVKATLFYNEIANQIFYDAASTRCISTYGCFETRSFTSKGVELSGQYATSDRVKLNGAYTFNLASDATGAQLARLPKHMITLGIEAEITDVLSAALTLQHAADVIPSVYALPGHKVGDYTLVGLTAEYAINDDWAVNLRVENLLGEDYETAGGYNTPGRSAFVGLSARF